jgi:hypothetical protein
MARQQQLTQWILSNQNALDLRVRELTWIRPAFPGMVDLSVTITLGGKDVRGRGIDQREDRALGKAVCEAIERFLCLHYGIPSTGVAGHYDSQEAKGNAKLEWIERSSLFSHAKNGISLFPLSSEAIDVIYGGQPTKAGLHTFQMTTPQGYSSIACLVEGLSTSAGFGGILGLGCDHMRDKAILKAKLECLRSVATLEDRPPIPISYSDFRKIEDPNADERKGLLFDFSYCSSLMDTLFKVSNTQSASVIQEPRLAWSEIALLPAIPNDCPLRFFRCLDQKAPEHSPYLEFVG